MKTIDLFCASPASTAICSSMDQKSIIRSIDRRRSNAAAPCSSHLPFDPSRKTSDTFRRKSCADADDIPPSSRYLLSDKPFIDFVPDSYPTKPPLMKDNRHNYKRMNRDAFRSLSTRAYESPVYNPSSSVKEIKLIDHLNSAKKSSNQQVIELRVSIHCKGCEGKLRKHISRMEGVRSFSIDLATKKVTVIGDVTPASVLTSISKVKNAQFWPSPTTTSTASSSSSSSLSPRLSISTTS